MSKLYLNSINAKNNVHTLDNRISGKYKLLSFSCTNNLFNINENNNMVHLNENGVNKGFSIQPGYYDITDLKSTLSTQLNIVCSGTMTVTLDQTTNKLTFSNDTHNFYFKFGTNTDNSARYLLGMNAVDGTDASSQTSDFPVDLNTYKNFFIDINEDNNKDVIGVNYFQTSLYINGLGAFGETLTHLSVDNFDQYVLFNNTKQFQIRIHDLNENVINLNSDYSIILEKL